MTLFRSINNDGATKDSTDDKSARPISKSPCTRPKVKVIISVDAAICPDGKCHNLIICSAGPVKAVVPV